MEGYGSETVWTQDGISYCVFIDMSTASKDDSSEEQVLLTLILYLTKRQMLDCNQSLYVAAKHCCLLCYTHLL